MTLTRRFTLAAALVGALVVSSAALGAGGVTGTYRTTITNSGHLNGKWRIELVNGTYRVSMNGNTLARGRYSATATTITFDRETSDCSGAGVYSWTRSGRAVTFVRKRETASCRDRAAVLTHRFTQVR